jgi:hypothetical protein
MKIKFIAFLLILANSAALFAGEEKSEENGGILLSGYFENQGFLRYSKSREKLTLLDYNKLRLDIKTEVSSNLTFNADIIFMTYHGTTTYNLLEFLPSSIASTVQDNMADRFAASLEDTYYLNDAYLTIYLDGLSVRIGKQQIPFGTGYTWNPTDNFQDKNQLDPAYEKRGVNAMTIDIPWGPEGSLTAITAIKENVENPSFALRLKNNIAGFDISGSWQFISENNINPDSFISIALGRNVFGFDFTGELFTLGFWGEGTFNIPNEGSFQKKNYTEYLIGLDYTFQNGIYVMSEYLHRSEGVSSSVQYNLFDYLRLFSGEITNIGTDYLVCGMNYPFTDYIKVQLYSIINIKDQSCILIPWLVWDAADNLEINLSLNIFAGEDGTEYGEYPHSALLRFRVYF